MDRPSAPAPGRQGPLLNVDVDGAFVRLRARYDPHLVDRLKGLPGRRYVARDTEWVLPARRDGLVALARLLVDLGEQAILSERARRRLERHGPGRLELCDSEFEIRSAPRPQRLERIRALPERRWLAQQRRWRVPATRAGALALAALLEDGELVATAAAATRVEHTAAEHPLRHPPPDSAAGAQRASPMPHWRHVTRGPTFTANPQRREWVPGVGWCVRVRVDPGQRPAVQPERERKRH